VGHIINEVWQTTSVEKNQTQAKQLVAAKVWLGKLWLGTKQAVIPSSFLEDDGSAAKDQKLIGAP
jgi:hypothetical protein